MSDVTGLPILVISPRWQTRALLAGQLGETCDRQVVSAPGVNEALGLVKIGGVNPSLVIVDAGRKVTPEGVERLLDGLPGVPLLLIASALRRQAFEPLRKRCAAYLVRPVSIGRVARIAARVLVLRRDSHLGHG